MTAPSIRLHTEDNIAIALADLPAGFILPENSIVLREHVKRGHKFALTPILAGMAVRRYGQIIGIAVNDIEAGDHVHVHNLAVANVSQDYAFCTDAKPLPVISSTRSFQGYLRSDMRAGTRNYIGVLTSVNCSGSVVRFIAEAAEKSAWFRQMTHVDGIVPIVHGTGCGMSGDDEGYQTLFRTLAGYARNPNFAGILLVGLGCEVMQIPDLVGKHHLRDDGNFRYMTIQQSGGTRRSVERGVELLQEIALVADTARRQTIPVSELVIGMQCGGSDGYSGITANPALGHASDLLVQHGGTTILSETPEIFGAEQLLTRRAGPCCIEFRAPSLPLTPVVSFDFDCDWHAECGEGVDATNGDGGFGDLGVAVAGPQFGADDGFVTGHRGFGEGSSVVAGLDLPHLGPDLGGRRHPGSLAGHFRWAAG